MPVQPIDPTDPVFGLTGDGTPNDQAKWQAVLDAVGTTQSPAQFGPGRFVVTMASANFSEQYSQFNTAGKDTQFTIKGAGPYATSIELKATNPIPPDSPPHGWLCDLARVDALGGAHLDISDIAFLGPESWDPTCMPNYPGDPTATPPVPGNNHFMGATANCFQMRGSAKLTTGHFRRVRWDGKWSACISYDTTPGDCLLVFDDCDFAAYGVILGVGAAADDYRRVHATNCRFNAAGIPAADNFGVPYNHLCYFAPGVNVKLNECSFENCDLNIQFFSGHGITTRPQYCELTDCTVSATVKGEILLPDGAIITGGEYHPLGGIVAGDGVLIVGAILDCTAGNGFQGGAPLMIKSCELTSLFACNIIGGYAAITGCTAKRGVSLASGAGITPAIAPKGGITLVSDCSLFGGDVRLTGSDRLPATEAIGPEGGSVFVRGGISGGDYGYFGSGRGAMALTDKSTATLDIEGHIFDLPVLTDIGPTDPQPAIYCDATIPANAAKARNCQFLGGCMPFSVSSPQAVEARSGTCPNVVASAPVMNLHEGFNYDRFHVSGTAAIGAITITNLAPENAIYNQRCRIGRVTFVADDEGLTFSSGVGTGALVLDSPITLAAGAQQRFRHRPEDCTWHPVAS
jgi:hypothetical protein